MVGQIAIRNRRPKRRIAAAINTLADKVKFLVCEMGRSRDLAERMSEFAELSELARQSREDFALSLAAAAVVEQYCELSDEEGFTTAQKFAARDPVCDIVLRSIGRGNSDVLLPAARELSAELLQNHNSFHQSPLVHFLESLTYACSKSQRKELGVYYTPAEVVTYLVERTNAVLREEFGADVGIGSLGQMMIDPAIGSGAFPLEMVRVAHRNWRGQSLTEADVAEDWNAQVSRCLLPSLSGCEIMPAAFVVANLLVAMELIKAGFRPSTDDRLRFRLGDALAKPSFWSGKNALPVIIGNPPYRCLSTNEHPWVTSLMRGESPDGDSCASYFHVDRAPLGERKTWLHDDYVKFIRVAQWQVERHGAGVLAFVTNHGYLDNPSFRGMRAALAETFDAIEVVDLHGNTKKSLNGTDDSVFETAQGMALTVAWRRGNSQRQASVRRGDLRGTRSEKLDALAEAMHRPVELSDVTLRSPHYLYDVEEMAELPEYTAGYRICDIMPVNTTAPVTARDWFVVDHDRSRLVERLTQFADLSISDDEIRELYFQRGRSSRYPPGDTRGWKLHDARRRLANEADWQQYIRQCWYRPFDRRWIFWTDWMVDWPRESVMQHFRRDNLALVCRRQSPRGRVCNYFGIVDDVTLDGFVRSDNRGSESIFPLHLDGENDARVNFSNSFIKACEAAWSVKFDDTSDPQWPLDQSRLSATDLLHFIYALFKSPTYQTRYGSELAIGFPHVLLAKDPNLFWRLSAIGKELAECQLLCSVSASECAVVSYHGESAPVVDSGFPKHKHDRVYINSNAWCESISLATWQYQIGAHQVLRKWLKDRRGNTIDETQLSYYTACVRAVVKSMTLEDQIDAAIDDFGGWPAAFVAE